MKELNNTNIFKNNIETDLKKEYLNALKNSEFENYIREIHLPYETLMKYTSRLEGCFKEYKNCKECKGLENCKNEVYGFCEKEVVDGEKLRFEYISCKYKNKELKDNKENRNVYVFDMPKDIKNAKMKDIYLDDASRKETIAWLTKFIKSYSNDKKMKGLYLNGNFGCGKTYLVSAMINELAKKDVKVAIVYFPDFLRELKQSFNSDEDFSYKFNYIKKVDVLLLDDIKDVLVGIEDNLFVVNQVSPSSSLIEYIRNLSVLDKL